MSAYTNARGGHVFSLNGTNPPINTQTPTGDSPLEQLPTLPQIANELEAYFTIARQIEAALIHERAQARKFREEIQDLQHKYTRLMSETENKLREFTLREERLKSQISSHQQTEKGLHDQVSDLCRQIETLRDERKKVEMDTELMRSSLDSYKRREQSFKYSLQSLQSVEKSRVDQNEKLNQELQKVRGELNRYQAAWSQVIEMDRKSKQALQENWDTKKKLEELSEIVKHERKRREDLEEALRKEKRDKQLALTCLHTAESKLAQSSRQLEEINRNQQEKESFKEKKFSEGGLELNF